jgi:hypothetical protein
VHSRHQKFYLIYIFWLLLFIFFTNYHYSYEQIISINQLDSKSYMSIAIFAPDYSTENISYHHAQRMFIPYVIGLFAYTLDVNPFIIFRFFTYAIILCIIFFHFLIIKKLKTNFFFSILSISLLILNPYLIRYFIAVPTMINDAVFVLSLYLFSIGLIFSYKSTLVGMLLALMSRQNGVFLFIAYIINNFFKKRFMIIKDSSTILSIVLFFIISLLSNNYADKVSINNFNFMHVYGIFIWVYESFDLVKLLKWILLPLYSYLPLIIISLFFFKFNELDKKTKNNFFILLFIFITIVSIPFLSGPALAGKNIIRLTSLAYPIVLIIGLCFMTIKNKILNKIIFFSIIIILHIWSFHPRYSIISTFETLRNYLI